MVEDRSACLNRFIKDVFFIEYAEFHSKVTESINKNIDNYIFQMKQMVKDFMKHIYNYRHIIGQPIGCIELSFLRLSVDEDNILFALEAFDEKQDMGKCVARYKLELNWFSEEWKELRQNLLNLRQDTQWAMFVREEDIYVMLQDALTALFAQLVLLFKYTFEVCDQWDEFKLLNISKSFFYISLGEYHDIQKLLYVRRDEFDIFMQDEKGSCRYGRFTDKVYREKTIYGRDFRGSVFQNCKFEKTRIEECGFYDNRFYNCYFYKCDLRDVKFFGAIFKECVFDECNLEGVEWHADKESAIKSGELYRQTLLNQCTIVRSNLLHDKMSECQLIDTDIKDVEGV